MHGKWTTLPISGHIGSLGPRRSWLSEVRALADDAKLTRVALAADFANPFAKAGDQRLGFINSDVTLYRHRLPVRRWISFEVVNRHATDGVAIGECWRDDERGAIGSSTVAALA